ncbi:class I SAM-dependent methyltransferase [Polynucleobacter bastaniensis]|uniref:class I SAM-dependent methyltransferase n=1 Tax=Polynucleobacter bastaniensis TaxID=2081039 RepID=UPI001C0ABF57|nr:class I SAM-dependent methyltransferase [Polynucleobacter bastaniensis]MBU3598279.1 class I SAM-dependent methyltransferase [Polynucleobacter bastaniensis]
MRSENKDEKTIEGFGKEWKFYSQNRLSDSDSRSYFNAYFEIFPWSKINSDSIGADIGCGSGRWAKFVAPRVGQLICIDPSNSIDVAKVNLTDFSNCKFIRATIDRSEISPRSLDFAYSLGVLHHIPDTEAALKDCVRLLKRGAPFLVYLYYAFDNRPLWFRLLWKISDFIRLFVCKLPFFLKIIITQLIAFLIYLPLSRLALLFEYFGMEVGSFPLSSYRRAGFYVMCTDSLDRFGTRLEHRYSRLQIQSMMEHAGLENIVFSDKSPYWCAVGLVK